MIVVHIVNYTTICASEHLFCTLFTVQGEQLIILPVGSRICPIVVTNAELGVTSFYLFAKYPLLTSNLMLTGGLLYINKAKDAYPRPREKKVFYYAARKGELRRLGRNPFKFERNILQIKVFYARANILETIGGYQDVGLPALTFPARGFTPVAFNCLEMSVGFNP